MQFTIRSIFANNPKNYSEPSEIKRRMINALFDGLDEEFDRLLGEYLQSYCQVAAGIEETLEEARFKSFYSWIQTIGVMFMHEMDEIEVIERNICHFYELEQARDLAQVYELDETFYRFNRELYRRSRVRRYSGCIEQVFRFVDEHIYEKLDLTNVASEIHYNPYYLSRKFKKETGITIGDYITEAKIKEACRLIGKNYSITEISYRLHFSSQSYFTHCFKNVMGIKPLQYKSFINS